LIVVKVRELIERVEPAVTMSYRQLLWIGLIGLGVGFVAWLLGMLLDAALFRLIFCRDAGLSGCAISGTYGNAASLLIATGVGVWALVRIQIFRPLLIGLAAALTLWGVYGVLDAQPWYVAMLVGTILFGLAYMLFGWIMRLRSMLWAIVISILLLVIVRFILNS
jgi:hypothetical protein